MRTRSLLTFGLSGLVVLLSSPQVHAAAVILNEYNAVSSSDKLDDGDGKDLFFGTIEGNGGNWFELMVVEDHVDMRGWKLDWAEDETVGAGNETAKGTITLSGAEIWSDMRSGTVITFIEEPNAGGKPTGTFSSVIDFWFNVSTKEEVGKGALALATTVTNDGSPGDFSVGKDDWVLTIRNAASNIVFGPVGEGADSWAGDSVKSEKAGSLEGPRPSQDTPVTLADWLAITPASDLYDDTGSSSFGQPNHSYNNTSATFSLIQDVAPLRSQVQPPTGDYDGDGVLTANDINTLTSAVLAGSTETKFDLNRDGKVDGDDRGVWVSDLKKTYFGDANLNGEFTSSDMIDTFLAGEYEDATAGNSLWEEGDWNGDTEFTSADMITAFLDGGYELGPKPAVAAVPEPHSLTLVLLALLSCRGYRSRREKSIR